MRKTALILTLSLLVLTSCNSTSTETLDTSTDTTTTETTPTQTVFSSDFGDACNGIAVNDAAPYTEAAGTHPVVLFGRDSSTESFYERSFTLPEAWQVDWEKAAEYQLVSCVTTTPKEMAESCEFDVDGDTYTLETHAADYIVSLYAAQTGAELASTTLTLPADDCPSLYYFSEKTEQDYPDYTQALTEFLKPYVQK